MIGILIGIIGLIITILLGIYSIRITKDNKVTKSILFKKKECFSLFDSAINNLKIDVRYRNNKIENVLILLKGEIENTGNIDIDRSSIYKPLKVITNEDFNWLEIKLINHENIVNSVIEKVNDKEISIEWDLLKKGENIEFEALIEAKKEEEYSDNYLYSFDFLDTLQFQFRITNVDNIDVEDKFSKSLVFYKKRVRRSILNYSIFIFFGIFFLSIPYLNNLFPLQNDNFNLYYEVSVNKNDSIFISRIMPQSKNTLILKDENKDAKLISINDFNVDYSLKKIKYTEENNLIWLIWIISFIIIMGGVFLIVIKLNSLNKHIKSIKNRNANSGS